MSGTTTFPLVVTTAGAQPTDPATLNAQLVANATALVPGLTTNLPGSLIDDISGTDTGALVVIDQARVEFINSLTPFGANAFLLNQLGQIYGVPIGTAVNTSVFVVFSGPPGYVLPQGFTVSDGTYQYVLQDGGIIATGGTTQPLSALATTGGSWAVPANTVIQLATSVPASVQTSSTPVKVTNPLPGSPATAQQTEEAYRAIVLQAGLVAAQGTPAMLKSMLNQVPGVIANLVSVQQQTTGGWEVIVGGSGDPYLIGYAIFYAMGDISILVGSTLKVTNISNANPAVVTTNLNHGYVTGQAAQINGATGISGINGVNITATVLSPTSFSIGVNTTASGTYTGNGVVTPNFRNVSIAIYDYPDTYNIPIVIPPLQTVTMTVTWNTTSSSIIAPATVASAAGPAIVAYVNGLPVGQPINLFELQATFQAAVANLIPLAVLTRLVFNVAINGLGVLPTAGTGIIAGDPESYFSTSTSALSIVQG